MLRVTHFLVVLCLLLLSVVSLAAPLRQHRDLSSSTSTTSDFKSQSSLQEGIMQDQPTSWPELVGMDGEEAKASIEADTDYKVYILKQGAMVTMDYRTDRVRIFVDTDGKVASTPRVG
eukprot:Nitzschia sp. Nitz4//scaffold18_size181773//65842//66195//NITZ4_001913-RA/size181773-processed-gene-0.14-mRNA-1//1//CDS//3329540005//5936//frame0